MIQEMIVRDYGVIEQLIELNQKELDEIGQGGQAMRWVGGIPVRRIIHDDKYIYLYQHNYNKYDYFCYTPELYSFLATPSKCSFRQNDRGRTQIDLRQYYKDGHGFAPMANRFAYYYNEYCNKMGMSIDRFINEFKGINDLSRAGNIHIDHANNDLDNNCYWNLSAIDGEKNNRGGKGTLLAEIKPPYYCYIVVMPDGDYRVEFGYIVPTNEVVGIMGQALYFHCQTINELNDFLHRVFNDFVAVDKLPPQLSKWGNPQYIRATYKDQKLHYAGNFEITARVAERLLAMDAEQFVEWDGTMKWVALHP